MMTVIELSVIILIVTMLSVKMMGFVFLSVVEP